MPTVKRQKVVNSGVHLFLQCRILALGMVLPTSGGGVFLLHLALSQYSLHPHRLSPSSL